MTMEVPKVQYSHEMDTDDSFVSSIVQKTKQSPFLMAGIASLITISGIGAYKWKTRKIPTQLFLIQLRLAAQGATIACIACGMGYHMLKDFIFVKNKPN